MASPAGSSTFSRSWMPALLTRTFRDGWLTARLSRAREIDCGSATSRTSASMPGCSAVISSRSSLRRPAMTTLLPASCRRTARPSPMPDVPPVIRTVLPVNFTRYRSFAAADRVTACDLDARTGCAPAAEKVYPWIGDLPSGSMWWRRRVITSPARGRSGVWLRLMVDALSSVDGRQSTAVDPSAIVKYLTGTEQRLLYRYRFIRHGGDPMQPIHVIAGILAVRAETDLAHSALPDAPGLPGAPPKRRPRRPRTASALHRIADAIS